MAGVAGAAGVATGMAAAVSPTTVAAASSMLAAVLAALLTAVAALLTAVALRMAVAVALLTVAVAAGFGTKAGLAWTSERRTKIGSRAEQEFSALPGLSLSGGNSGADGWAKLQFRGILPAPDSG